MPQKQLSRASLAYFLIGLIYSAFTSPAYYIIPTRKTTIITINALFKTFSSIIFNIYLSYNFKPRDGNLLFLNTITIFLDFWNKIYP